MHIPDGYLSPQTYVPLYIVFIASTAVALKKVKQKIELKLIPFLGMAAAFSFLIMMFNIPIPGGTSGHATGSAIISIILGPWIAFISVTVALIIQALVFGDGGITSLGANCINLALIMPFIAHVVFRFLKGSSGSIKRMNIAAFAAGYIGLNITALVTAIEFGIQPLIASSANGNALYAPYPLSVAIPAMAIQHLLFLGIIEGMVTMLIFKYFYKNYQNLISANN